MSGKIAVAQQKGGVGKSTLCRLLAGEYAKAGWEVKIADMDYSQGTSFNWVRRRLENFIKPEIPVELFSNVDRALKACINYDLIIFDGAPHSTSITLDIAKISDLVVLPTGLSSDDLEPAVKLAHELKKKEVDVARIAFALCRTGTSSTEIEEARNYIASAGYFILDGDIPEKTAYRRATDTGHTLTETHYKSLNDKAEHLAQSIVNRLEKRMK